VLFTSKQTPGLIPDVIVFREPVLRARPADIRAFVRAWFQAVEYWQSNPKEGNAIIGKVLNIPPETISLEGVKLLTLNDNQQGFTSNNSTDSLYYTAQLYANFFVRTGGLTRPPEINQLLDPSFLK
jgi:NitT/TauT family transport system substrate-binding protein